MAYVEVTGKNQTEPRTAPLTIEAHTVIQKWLDARPLQSENILTGFQGRPRDFRRFVGTQLAKRQGVHIAQKVLGHADVSTTLNNYVLTEIEGNETEGLF